LKISKIQLKYFFCDLEKICCFFPFQSPFSRFCKNFRAQITPLVKKLQQELDELRKRMDEKENDKNAVDEQMAIMERSYQMASKYLPLNPGTTSVSMPAGMSGMTGTGTVNAEPQPSPTSGVSGKTVVVPVGRVNAQTVSILRGEISNAEIIEAFAKPRNTGFITAAAESDTEPKNTVSACIHDNQTVRDGQNVQLRLLEAMRAGATIIPRNAVMSGTAKIQGERLNITVGSLEYRGMICGVLHRTFSTV
jgi:conjugative transposon TraM protein